MRSERRESELKSKSGEGMKKNIGRAFHDLIIPTILIVTLLRPFYFNDSVKQGTLCQRPPVPKDVFAGSIILFYGKQPTK